MAQFKIKVYCNKCGFFYEGVGSPDCPRCRSTIDTTSTRPQMDELPDWEILAQECERADLPNAARDLRNLKEKSADIRVSWFRPALAAMSRVRASTPAQSGMVAEVLAICADHKARADVPKRDDWQLGYAAACREIAVDVRCLAVPSQPAQ